jgi:hypothetical protein
MVKSIKVDYNNPKVRYKNEKDKLPAVLRKLVEYCKSNGLMGGIVLVPDGSNELAKPLSYYTHPREEIAAIIETEDRLIIIDNDSNDFVDGFSSKPPTEIIPDIHQIIGTKVINKRK